MQVLSQDEKNQEKDIEEKTENKKIEKKEEEQKEIEVEVGTEIKGEKGEEKRTSFVSTVFDRVLILVSLFLIFASIFLVQFCIVSGESMYPTLNDGDVVFIEKITDEYERMDIVVIKHDGRYLIKRVIGLPGEEIKIENGKVFINGNEIEDVAEGETSPGIAKDSILLGENEYFLLGDNREKSVDSRDELIGIVKRKNIVGKSVFVFDFFD